MELLVTEGRVDTAHASLPTDIWQRVLGGDGAVTALSRRHVSNLRLTCRAWRHDIDRCLPSVRLQHALPCKALAAAARFQGVSQLELHFPGRPYSQDGCGEPLQLLQLSLLPRCVTLDCMQTIQVPVWCLKHR